jgi:hypothetical protein
MASSVPCATIICKVPSVEMARKLPRGSIVGDRHGGVTFNDAVATVLESRSRRGWRELQLGAEKWTVIELDR